MNSTSINKIIEQITSIGFLLEDLNKAKNLEEKNYVLDLFIDKKMVKENLLDAYFKTISLDEVMLLKSLIAMDQKHILLALIHDQAKIPDEIMGVIKEIDRFYGPSHGLFVYQLNLLHLILEDIRHDVHTESNAKIKHLKPHGIDLSEDSSENRKMVRLGIENLDKMAEIYPLGGAGERFKLKNHITNEPLPVALLPFLGTSLLEGLIRDLTAREFLYYKLMKKEIKIPVAMMTSEEKGNHDYIQELLVGHHYFNRSKDSYFIFSQNMVPVTTIEGKWVLSSENQLLLKPGGHGVIWKTALEKGVLDWFKELKKVKLLTRQINNPIAGVDSGLLGFLGVGFKGNHLFGFSSCDRHVHASEGMDILVEKDTAHDFEYRLVNVEYTELAKNNIQDEPKTAGGQFSKFPANTNILFLDIENIKNLVKKRPIPGMLINMKTKITYVDATGALKEILAGRLESTMQNIADEIVDCFPKKIKPQDFSFLSSYLTYNKRNKTISVTKKGHQKNEPILETPEGCLYDIYKNYHELLSSYCQLKLPEISTVETYLKYGPSIYMLYHPALGPLYSVIAQKIRKGHFLKNSELQLEITEVDIENLELDGSLLIYAEHAVGSIDQNNHIQYGKNLGKCILKNVKVKNRGINREAKNCYWKNEVERFESLNVHIHGNGEFIAENVTFKGNLNLEVMDGERLIVSANSKNELVFKREKITKDSPYWDYLFDAEDHIILKRCLFNNEITEAKDILYQK